MKLGLIGVGLIGGSLARAARAANVASEVVGYDTDAAALALAKQIGAISEVAASPAAAVQRADIVVLAVPVGMMGSVMKSIAPHLNAKTIVTDVGSTKADVLAASETLGAHRTRFVPGHPIAGRERPGVAASDPRLFEGKLFISTPNSETEEPATVAVEALWRAVGCRTERMNPHEHDRVFAAVSHLPHLLAFALVAQIAQARDAERKLAMAGAGFRDFTRIAASSPAMWRDVCLANRDALGKELNDYRALLSDLQNALDAEDAHALEAVFQRAAECRRRHAPALDAE